MKRILLPAFLFLVFSCSNAQKNILNKEIDSVEITSKDIKMDTIADTTTKSQFIPYTPSIGVYDSKYFSVTVIKGKLGYWAIDHNGKVLFEVKTLVDGEPGPDEIQEGMLRIIDKNRKMGFANEYGKIVIKPQFDMLWPFQNGKAIFGRKCKLKKRVVKSKFLDGMDVECVSYGYVDKKGKIKAEGYASLDEVGKLAGSW